MLASTLHLPTIEAGRYNGAIAGAIDAAARMPTVLIGLVVDYVRLSPAEHFGLVMERGIGTTRHFGLPVNDWGHRTSIGVFMFMSSAWPASTEHRYTYIYPEHVNEEVAMTWNGSIVFADFTVAGLEAVIRADIEALFSDARVLLAQTSALAEHLAVSYHVVAATLSI